MKDLSLNELYDIAKSLGIDKYTTLKKEQLLEKIISKLSGTATARESSPSKEEVYKRVSSNKYKMYNQIGNTGKDAKTYLVKDKYNNEYAMKTFKKSKSGKKIAEEVALQKICSDAGISPKVVDYDTESKFIVMEKMEGHLFDVINEQRGVLTKEQQEQVIRIFKTLDKVGVFHGDSNMMNYMYRGDRLYIIDFGYGKQIDESQIKKLGTQHPNMEIMLLGFILKLREFKCPADSYKTLAKYLPHQKREEFNLT
jgi:tRNA A-37 threonylcarbamoyl transferase component Bud32